MYYRISLFILYFDERCHYLTDLSNIYIKVFLSFKHIVPFYTINSNYTNILDTINIYQTDFEDNYNLSIMKGEWRQRRSKWKQYSKKCDLSFKKISNNICSV